MKAKILKLIAIFIGSIPFYFVVNYLIGLLFNDTFNLKSTIIGSTAFAFAMTASTAYRWFKSAEKQNR